MKYSRRVEVKTKLFGRNERRFICGEEGEENFVRKYPGNAH
jgi:hypothetical protein